jgi:hypothetical protein
MKLIRAPKSTEGRPLAPLEDHTTSCCLDQINITTTYPATLDRFRPTLFCLGSPNASSAFLLPSSTEALSSTEEGMVVNLGFNIASIVGQVPWKLTSFSPRSPSSFANLAT